ncbi:MAG: nickel-dependent hydrogenase large subunit [Candidatus Bathyarchaeota archaeon]
MPNITSRICGVCPEAHSMASTKTLDAIFNIEPSSAVKKIRELLYSAFHFSDKITNFYILAGADFVVGPEASPAERNVLGLIAKVGKEAGLSVIRHRLMGHKILQMIGGRQVHANYSIPGGVSKPLTKDEVAEIHIMGKQMVEFGKFTLQVFDDIVLKNKTYVDLILSEHYTSEMYYMGTVDKNNHVNFYDGKLGL